ncbi:MAG: hypothetical protein COX62_06650 [Deltaproteobacteria bacterium CG_4_10_14_0_2_um_filter_43_8]|nr:MAG: hypothetical protein COV43_02030 [Deltaproteobacteria bacterium CG11_big_fil_rev_8_21_14_0_20_42_23]PJA19492.1 MAG: hypothetical protein COX62_06650 [Deltaproteobacteria bacterium CG_4_10_14_0_2_um_filter_43_8]PJC63891.1 MAG: hypothetical protein CO021_07210 [Deltaproteobacteria bacterium CG_4_9_14_0_2_um_filter_42_21]
MSYPRPFHLRVYWHEPEVEAIRAIAPSAAIGKGDRSTDHMEHLRIRKEALAKKDADEQKEKEISVLDSEYIKEKSAPLLHGEKHFLINSKWKQFFPHLLEKIASHLSFLLVDDPFRLQHHSKGSIRITGVRPRQ